MVIDLPDYYPIFDNQIYASVKKEKGNQKLVTLRRYFQPDTEHVIKYLLYNFKKLSSVGADTEGNWSKLEEAIINIPKHIRINVGIKDEKSLDFLRKHTSASDFKNFLCFSYGYLPAEAIQNLKKTNNPAVFDQFYSKYSLETHGVGKIFDYELPYDFFQEEKNMVIYMNLLRSTSGNVFGDAYQEMEDLLTNLAKGLGEQEKFELVPLENSLGKNLEELALEPLTILHSVLKKHDDEEKAKKLFEAQQALRNAFKLKK